MTGLPPYSSKKKQTLVMRCRYDISNIDLNFFILCQQKDYIDYIEQQNVDMIKMLDPKGHWPKRRGSYGRCLFGLELLEVAKLATSKDSTQRPEITTVSYCLLW